MTPKADLAVIYAGGHGTRLLEPGQTRRDKGALDIAGTPMFAHVAGRLAPQAERLAVIAPEPPDWLGALPAGTRHLADRLGEGGRPAGPAGALVIALRAGLEIGEDALVLTAPIDSPFLPPDLYESLAGALEASGAGAALVSTRGKLHPVFSLWRAALADTVVSLVEAEKIRALHQIAAACGAVEVMAWDDVTLPPPFFNVNSEDELSVAQDLARLVALRG